MSRFGAGSGDSYLRQALSSVDYDTDVAHKQTISTHATRSRTRYAAMVSTTQRFNAGSDDTGAGTHLGPGSIDVNRDGVTPHRPQTIISATQRFNTHVDPSKNLGGTYRASE